MNYVSLTLFYAAEFIFSLYKNWTLKLIFEVWDFNANNFNYKNKLAFISDM